MAVNIRAIWPAAANGTEDGNDNPPDSPVELSWWSGIVHLLGDILLLSASVGSDVQCTTSFVWTVGLRGFQYCIILWSQKVSVTFHLTRSECDFKVT